MRIPARPSRRGVALSFEVAAPGAGMPWRARVRRLREWCVRSVGWGRIAVSARGVLGVVLAATALLPAIARAEAGARMFANESLLFFQPQPQDRFAGALASGDFDGDGVDDLATGIPFDDGFFGFETTDVGAVVVRYGARTTGFPPDHADGILNELVGGSPDPGEADDRFGWALAACDFNRDGFDDLAVGVPFQDGGEDDDWPDSGAVDIFYGGPGGLEIVPEQHFTEDTPGIPGTREPRDELGYALACGDLNGDGFADLVMGAPEETVDETFTVVIGGVVIAVYGTAGGLDPQFSFSLNEDNVSGLEAEDWDEFGQAVAIGDFDFDGVGDLAVGAPGEDSVDDDPATGMGIVAIFFGQSAGVTTRRIVGEGDLGGAREKGDQFGWSLAVGDFDRDEFDDLAIGAPFEDLNTPCCPSFTIVDTGQVAVMYGGPRAETPRGELWTRGALMDSFGESGELFGFALAAGDLDHDHFADLAIGMPGKVVTGIGDGAVDVLMGGAAGLDPTRSRELAEGGGGLPGSTTMHDLAFGRALATGDFDGDRAFDLVIGIPNQDGPGGANVGAEMVIYGGLLSDGFESGATARWTGTVPP